GKMTPVGRSGVGLYRVKSQRLSQRPETSHGVGGRQMQQKLASARDVGRRHLVTVRKGEGGRPEIGFAPEMGGVGRAFAEASKWFLIIGRADSTTVSCEFDRTGFSHTRFRQQQFRRARSNRENRISL